MPHQPLRASVTRVEITRHTVADPTSVALLLSGPVVESAGHGNGSDLTGELSPVRRSGVGFAAGVDVAVGDGRTASGLLTVVPAIDAGCDVRITLSPVSDEFAASATGWATRFLESLAERARRRASAA
jgi:hypothetical protein